MSTQRPSQRIFTAKDFVKDLAERTVQSAYKDQDISAFVEWIDPGKTFQAPHSHPQSAHIFVFLEGEGEALLGNGRWEKVRAGQFLVCPRDKVHAMRNTSGKRVVWVSVDVNNGQYVVTPNSETDD